MSQPQPVEFRYPRYNDRFVGTPQLTTADMVELWVQRGNWIITLQLAAITPADGFWDNTDRLTNLDAATITSAAITYFSPFEQLEVCGTPAQLFYYLSSSG